MDKYFLAQKWNFLLIANILFFSCTEPQEKREEVLFQKYCASCHLAPKIEHLPKGIWKNSVLPDMMARMDIEEIYDAPTQTATVFRPKIKLADWLTLQQYIISNAPDSLEQVPLPNISHISNFTARREALDDENGALFTFLQFILSTSKNFPKEFLLGFSFDTFMVSI